MIITTDERQLVGESELGDRITITVESWHGLKRLVVRVNDHAAVVMKGISSPVSLAVGAGIEAVL